MTSENTNNQTPIAAQGDAPTSNVAPGRPERPIETPNEDSLSRTDFVRRLADALIDKSTQKSRGIAIGITGPWGSGKSSVLNLLRQHIKTLYPEAIVVRFDPWLVSGRNDLISEFIRELIRTINADSRASEQFKLVAGSLAKYGEYLAPVVATWVPLLGPVIKGGSGLIRDAVKSDESLTGLKARLIRELAAINAPLVVLIDEVDRVEDDEIRTIAQLVRSVADFPGISYVLAYDSKRVIQALGAGAAEGQREERGRAYLEKIVQLQIPLPVTFAQEIARLLAAELVALTAELRLPENFQNIERYQALMKIFNADVINTPRDIGRLIGTFHAIGGMLRDEVDWIDLLGFSGLMIKAPLTAELIKTRPDEFTDEILSEASMMRRIGEEKLSPADKLNALLPESENQHGIKRLIAFLFPKFSSQGTRRDEMRMDAIYRRRPLLTTLRLGLAPGGYSRAAIEDLLNQPPDAIAERLRKAYKEDTLAQLTDRLDEIYSGVPSINHVAFWRGVGAFLKKPDCEWVRSYSPMHEVVQNMAEILERCVLRNPSFQTTAATIFSNLRGQGEDQLTANWIRRQIFLHGLFGRQKRSENASILNAEQTEALANDMSHGWRTQHLSGKLIPCRWDLMPVYTMLDTGVWDDLCRVTLDEQIATDAGLDAFTLMLYGAHFTTDQATVERMCSYESYIQRVRERLDAKDADETVRVALRKAQAGGW